MELSISTILLNTRVCEYTYDICGMSLNYVGRSICIQFCHICGIYTKQSRMPLKVKQLHLKIYI